MISVRLQRERERERECVLNYVQKLFGPVRRFVRFAHTTRTTIANFSLLKIFTTED
jgi:hypothetical protein